MALQYREVTGYFTARIPDSGDADLNPDTVPLTGNVTFHPEYRKPLVFPGEHIVLEPINAIIIDGQLMGEVIQNEDVVLQALHLPVTMDERANQTWSWTMRFHGMTLGQYGETVELPDVRFVIEEGDGPLDLSTVPQTTARASSNFITRGTPGAGLQDIIAADGEIVFSWDNGRETTIDVPDAVPGPEGAPGPPGSKGDPGDVRFEGIDPGITVRTDDVLIGDTAVPSTSRVDELTKHTPRDVDSDTWAFVETDEEGRISRAVDAEGRTWLMPHPDSPHIVDTRVAGQIQYVSTNDWSWAVTDSAGQVALGVRPDGTVYPAAGDRARGPYDLILVIGQSNAQGAGRPVIYTEVWPNIWQYPAHSKPQTGIVPALERMPHQGPIVGPTGHGPGLFFVRQYSLDHPGRDVLIVPAAYSGTGFSTSAPANGGTWDWTAPDDGTNLALNALRQCQDALAAAGPGSRLAAIVWHQGEGDVGIADQYAGYLDGLIAWLRAELGAPTVPFVAGMLAHEVAHLSANYETITRAHFGVQTRNEYTGFARSSQALSNPGDRTHFSARGQMLMGERMYAAWRRSRHNYDQGVAPTGVENLTARRVGDEVRVSWDESWSRVEDYLVEWSTDGETWSTTGVEKFAPLACEASFPAPTGVVHVRVTATNTYGASFPFVIDA